jgi:hypothetical protein
MRVHDVGGRDEIHRYTDRENMNDTGHAMVVVLVPYEWVFTG